MYRFSDISRDLKSVLKKHSRVLTKSDKDPEHKSANHGCLIVISYETLRANEYWFTKRDLFYVILDEGHKIKNPNTRVNQTMKKLNASHRIILSGTPIQNSIEELWSLMDFLEPGKLGTLEIFKEDYCN